MPGWLTQTAAPVQTRAQTIVSERSEQVTDGGKRKEGLQQKVVGRCCYCQPATPAGVYKVPVLLYSLHGCACFTTDAP